MRTGDSKSVALNTQYNQAGDIIWLSGKNKVVLAQAKVDYEGNSPDLFSVTIIDLNNRSVQTIINDNQLEIRPTKWLDDTKIELTDIEGKIWIFNTTDNSLQESTK